MRAQVWMRVRFGSLRLRAEREKENVRDIKYTAPTPPPPPPPRRCCWFLRAWLLLELSLSLVMCCCFNGLFNTTFHQNCVAKSPALKLLKLFNTFFIVNKFRSTFYTFSVFIFRLNFEASDNATFEDLSWIFKCFILLQLQSCVAKQVALKLLESKLIISVC